MLRSKYRHSKSRFPKDGENTQTPDQKIEIRKINMQCYEQLHQTWNGNGKPQECSCAGQCSIYNIIAWSWIDDVNVYSESRNREEADRKN